MSKIDQNNNPESVPQGYNWYAKNILVNQKLDADINEKGTLEYIDYTPFNIQWFNGTITLGNLIIQFYKDNNNNDCILVVDENFQTATVKLVRNDFGFDKNKPITGRAKLNSKGELIVAFTDGGTPRYINLDTASSLDSLTSYNLFPVSNNPNINPEILSNAGNILSGCYFISIQYIDKNRSRSSFSQLSKPIYITTFDESSLFEFVYGVAGGTSTNKAIKINLTSLDTTYSRIAIAIVSKINGVVSAKLVKEVPISGTNMTIIYNGIEFLNDLTIAQVLTKNPIYEKVRIIREVNDRLIGVDVTAKKIINFQSIANSVRLQWTSTLDTSKSLTSPSDYNNGLSKTFMHGEVYAMYIEFELSNGEMSPAFHIPALEGSILDYADSDFNAYTGGLLINNRNPKKYELEDTIYLPSLIFTSPSVDNPYPRWAGDFGTFYNNDETYPSDFPDFAGQAVRHFKFPSLAFCNSQLYSSNSRYLVDQLDILGIKVKAITIPDEYKDLIKGYRISYAKRSLAEQGIKGHTILQFSGYAQLDATESNVDKNKVFNTSGNFKINNSDYTVGNPGHINPSYDYVRLHGLDFMLDKPSIDNVFVENVIKQKINDLNQAASASNNIGRAYNGQNSLNTYSYISNFTKDGQVVKSTLLASDRIRKLTNTSYIPSNVVFSLGGVTIDNLLSNECLFAKFNGGLVNISFAGLGGLGNGLRTDLGSVVDSSGLFEEIFHSLLRNPKANYFLDYTNQTLIPLSPLIRDFNNDYYINNEGDSFIGIYSYVSVGPVRNNRQDAGDPSNSTGVKNIKIFAVNSWNNPTLRYQTSGDYSTYFYPASGNFNSAFSIEYWLAKQWANQPFNVIQYNKDYSSVNEYESISIYNPQLDYESEFPYRIILSPQSSRSTTLEDSWRTFLANDYFDVNRNKGKIINVESWGTDLILIHQERSLLRTRDKGVLKTSTLNVTLGSGDLFAIEPQEANQDKSGYGGTQHMFSCLLCEFGYLFVDADKGSVYLYNGESLEDIGKGLRLLFRDYLGASDDNPFNSQGITIASDSKNKRIILSQKGNVNFTFSYNVLSGEWSCGHDYIPDYIFNTRKNLFSLKNNKLYIHNKGPRGNFYGITYPSYVDYVLNNEKDKEKLLSSIIWRTNNKDANNNSFLNKTITKITIWSDTCCTGEIIVKPNLISSLYTDANTKYVDGNYSFDELYNRLINIEQKFISDIFSDFRPISANLKNPIWHDSEPLRGHYFIVRLEFDNNEDIEMQFKSLNGDLRLSKN